MEIVPSKRPMGSTAARHPELTCEPDLSHTIQAQITYPQKNANKSDHVGLKYGGMLTHYATN
jgi:hypothetical protein